MSEFTQADYLILIESLITLRFNFINRMSSCGDGEARMWSNQVDKIDVLFSKVQRNYQELRAESIRNTDALKIEESDNIPCDVCDDRPGHEPKGSFGI